MARGDLADRLELCYTVVVHDVMRAMGLRDFTLPPELRSRIPELHLRHLIGLRFASDTEMPALVGRCLSGEFPTADAVKRAVQTWRPDYLRA